ncbi:MAG: 50S ribosomal protein L22 [Bacteroidales bacterium]
MGARKRESAEKRKEEMKDVARAVLRNCPSSPRKMRYVIDMIRGLEVNKALDILHYSNKQPARLVEKLLKSAISNWQSKNEGLRIEDTTLYIREVFVDQGRTLKRIQPAPQGRAYRVRKRSNHVTMILDHAQPVTSEVQTN